MVEVARNPNIEILTYTEVQGVSGRPGEFKVELLQNARYVNTETCTGCEACLEKCPIIVPNEFNNGLGTRGAIYVLFAQAVPKIAVINKEDCIECGACQKACLSESIDLEQQPKTKEIEVGAIIVATGFAPYDASENNDYGYGIYENVVTQSDLERLLNPTGPTSGHLVRISDSKTPNKIAMVQCVGSRDLKTNPHCSQVCCMVAMKNAQLIKQEYPDADITIYYIDIRTPDKACEEYYARVRDAGIKFVRGKIAEVKENKETKNLKIRVENTLTRELIRDEVDMLVLSAGIVPGDGTLKIAEILRLDRGPSGFLKPIHECLSPQNTKAPGIYIGGGAHGPKNIPYSVAGANGVAALAAAFVQGKIMLELMVPVVNESLCISCGTCERVCPFNAVEVIDEVAQVSEVACTGCGLCVSVCPTKALSVRYHRDEQILREISGTLKPTLKVKT
jgi:heterodisulfide reductase subunit A